MPVPSKLSEPFWAACKRHELRVQRCQRCGAYRFPPAILCPECLSLETEWTGLGGRGRVFSYVVYHRLYHPAFEADLPYAVALIELEEGVRMIANVVGIAPEKVTCDMPVEVVFEDVTPEVTLPKFRPLRREHQDR
ncbi:MAG: Zn-ribbon domain-containing OB-fold protein [Deltaproteobacteria bacterium]|nr:Zn-ribbon domain-containing OB-fold protein [Deltaproteobacteria bacterium]